MSNFKKAFTIAVSALTVIWSVGVAAVPSTGHAAAAAGSLIKMAGNASVYYLAANGKRYDFPNQTTYNSWYKDFSGVMTIPSSELQSYPIGGNITVRPGTKLVKITTDPKVYAVEPGGLLRWVTSESVAVALYGPTWAQRVVDVPDAFFVNYNSNGSSITTNVHPTGTVIKYANSATMYYVDNGVRRPFASDAAFAANWMNSANVITTAISYPDGSSVTGQESALVNVSGGSSTTTIPSSSAGLTVGAGMMTASTSLPLGAMAVKVGDYNFTAGPEGAVMLSSVTFKRIGVGNVSDITNAYLYDGMNRLTSGRTFNTSTNEATFTINLSVPASSTKTLSFVISVSTTASSGDQHAFEIESASKVSSNATAVNGTFPVMSNTHSIAGATAGTLAVAKSGSLSNPRVGDRQIEVSEFKLTASTEDAWVKQVTLTQGGNVSNSAMSNFKLMQNGSQVATASMVASNDRLDLVFSPAFKIEKGNNRIFMLYADVDGRPNDTISFYLEDTADVQSTGGTFGVGMTISINANFDAADDSGLVLTLQGGQFTITFDGPSSTNISNAASDVVIWKGTVYSANQVDIRNWRFGIEDTQSAGAGLCEVGTCDVQDIKLWNLDNNTVIAGPLEFTAAADLGEASTPAYLQFTDDYTLNAGSTTHIGLSVDVRNTPASTILALVARMGNGTNSFTANDIKNTGSNTYLSLTTDIVPSTEIVGQTQTVVAGGLTVTTAASPTAHTLIKGASADIAGAFNFAAGSGAAVKVNTVQVKVQTDDDVSGWNDDGVSPGSLILSAKLMDGTTQVGTTKSFTVSSNIGTATFDNLNWPVSSSQTKKLDVVIATNSAASLISSNSDGLRVFIATAGVTAVDDQGNSLSGNIPSSQQNGSTVTVKSGGTLTVAAAPTPTNPSASLIVAGSTDKVLAAFKFTATDDSFFVKKFDLESSATAATARVATLKVRFPMQNGTTTVQTVGLSGSSTTNGVDISSTPMYVAQNGNATLEVLIDAAAFALNNGTENGTNAAGQLGFTLDANNTNSLNQATGVASNTDSTSWGSDVSGNTHEFYRTILSAAAGSGTPNNTARSRSATQNVASLNLSASSNSNAFFRGSKKGADGATTDWTANGMAAAATSATAVSGSSSILLAEDGASAVNDSTNYDFGSGVDLTPYNKLGFWIRGSVAKAVGDVAVSVSSTADATDDATLNGLGTVTQSNVNLPTAITNASQWYYEEYSITTVSTDRFVTFNIKANVDNSATLNIEDLRFYRDNLNIDVAGDLNATIATSNGVLFSLKDSGGTTRMYGGFQGAGSPTGASTTAGTVTLIAGDGGDVSVVTTYSDVEVSSTTLALDLQTNTSSLMKADTSGVNEGLSVSVDTGTTSTNGDFNWYDNSDSAGSNDMASVTVVNPTSTTLTFANTY